MFRARMVNRHLLCAGRDLDLRGFRAGVRVAPMQWSMPHRVLQVVAVLIGLVAVSAFAAGVVNAPSRGRMPGEKAAGQA